MVKKEVTYSPALCELWKLLKRSHYELFGPQEGGSEGWVLQGEKKF